MNEHNKQHNNSSNGWNLDDKKKIAGVMLPLIEMQKAYGRTLDVKLVMSGWEMALSNLYSAEQVCFALQKYVLVKSDFPAPSDINLILNPPKPEITQAEYIAAKDWQKRNGFPMFSDALDTIKAFEKQESRKRQESANSEAGLLGDGRINKIVNETANRLTNQRSN